jgi:CAAX protease family protein
VGKSFSIAAKLTIYIGIYLTSQVLLTVVPAIIYGIYMTIINHGKIDPLKIQRMTDLNILYILIGSVLISLTVYVLIFRANQEPLFSYCNFSALKMSQIGLAVLLGLAFNYSLTMVDLLTSFYRFFPDHEKLMATLIGGDFIFTILIVGIMIPTFEEILFRGIVFNELRKHLSLGMAVMVQGLIFGIYHMNLLQGMYGTILGILAALVYLWYHSIWAPIFVHASFNTLSVIMSRVGDELILSKYGVELLIVSGLILGSTIYLLWKNRLHTRGFQVPL